jgi:hypothetical protein
VLNKDGGTFITTPNIQANGAITNRFANLKFDDGELKGTIDVRFVKQEALTWRLSEITSDEAEFKTDLENDMKRLLPGGSTVNLTSIDHLKDEDQPLEVHYKVEVLTTASVVGSRLLLPMEIFQYNDRNPFVHEQRQFPVYFSYPYQEIDQINIQMPPEFSVENLPQAKVNQTDFGYYDAKWVNVGSQLQLVRRVAMLGFFMPKAVYPQIRTFFQQMSSTDQESVVLRAQKTASK